VWRRKVFKRVRNEGNSRKSSYADVGEVNTTCGQAGGKLTFKVFEARGGVQKEGGGNVCVYGRGRVAKKSRTVPRKKEKIVSGWKVKGIVAVRAGKKQS